MCRSIFSRTNHLHWQEGSRFATAKTCLNSAPRCHWLAAASSRLPISYPIICLTPVPSSLVRATVFPTPSFWHSAFVGKTTSAQFLQRGNPRSWKTYRGCKWHTTDLLAELFIYLFYARLTTNKSDIYTLLLESYWHFKFAFFYRSLIHLLTLSTQVVLWADISSNQNHTVYQWWIQFPRGRQST